MTELLAYAEMASPIGDLRLVSRHNRFVAVDFKTAGPRLERLLAKRFPRFELRAEPMDLKCLERYFSGAVRAIEAVDLDLQGTDFQRRHWQALQHIPPGQTQTYAGLAQQLCRPTAIRAIGRANALNPLSILIPCHRLLGADGALTGYAGGLAAKQWLLDHERAFARIR